MSSRTNLIQGNEIISDPKQDCLVLSGYGLSLKVDSGKLIINDGFVNEGNQRKTILSRGRNCIERLVILGHNGNMSLDAIRWLMDANITTTIIDNDGKITTSFDPTNRSCSTLKKAQALSCHSRVDIKIAEYLLIKKLEGQIESLHYLIKTCDDSSLLNDEKKNTILETISFIEDLKCNLPPIYDVEDVLLIEANAAAKYWRAWEGIQLKWFNSSVRKYPEHWQHIQYRTSGKYGEARHATDPVNAIFNFCYSILEAKAKTACIKAGLDTDLGIIHADRDNRAAFVYDIMDPARPIIDRYVIQFVGSHKFKSNEFHETREGVCRLDPDIINLLMRKYPDVEKELDKVLIEVKRILKGSNKKNKDNEPLLYHTRRVHKHEKKELFCTQCGLKIETQGKKFCSRECYWEWKKSS